MQRRWQFWIDRGGTFTDVIGVAPDGTLHVRKVLSTGAPGTDPGLTAVRSLLEEARVPGDGVAPGAAAEAPRIAALKVGTTVATNALLERRGEPVVLVTTAGFGDGLAIGDQSRPDIFARRIVLPDRLYCAVIEANERIDAAGRVLVPLDERTLRGDLAAARTRGATAVAIVFLHSWRFPGHERRAAAIARESGFDEVSVSHEVSPLVRYVPRGETTVLNAYLAAPIKRYVSVLERSLAEIDASARLTLMQSHGGLGDAATFHAASSLLSGPAGGIIGAAHVAGRLGITRLIGFDMGGTSTDVALFDGELPRRFEHAIAGVRVQAPMLDVHTIAAGGGSILRFDDGRLTVGPESAGADPGPACYGRGGPPTLTDAQVLLGRLRPDTLPEAFGRDGRHAIDAGGPARAFAALAAEIAVATGRSTAVESLAESFLSVGIAAMANAIRRVSVQRGLEAQNFTLVCFGGAAGQHACRVAQAAGMRRILVHPLASVLSAYGIGVADRSLLLRTSLRVPLDDHGLHAAAGRFSELELKAREALFADAGDATISIARTLELRAGDSESTLAVPLGPLAEVVELFRRSHRQRFGFDPDELRVSIEALGLEARQPSIDAASLRAAAVTVSRSLPPTARVWFDSWQDVPLVTAASLEAEITGPALIVEPHSTLVLESGWTARRLPGGEILAEDTGAGESHAQVADPARIEIFNNLFMHVAEQMGEVLRQTAQSVNIKERLDYSCALFDAEGGLVANAPHMPVHLGSMGASVRAVIDAHHGRMSSGDAWLINSPYAGGTHLPDMTVVSPVFLESGADTAAGLVRPPDFFVASRAHHADVGGTSPGSMPAFSQDIAEEGVLFGDFQLVSRGRLRERELREQLAAAPWPARKPDQNLADLAAQLAANARGAFELERAARQHGVEGVRTGMRQVQENAAECVRNAIGRLRPGEFCYEMDGGQRISVRIDVDTVARSARVDFSGTSPQGRHNFNAPRAVAIAAVLYVFRTLVDRPIPLNQGCLLPLEISIPPGSMLDPQPPAAVAAGNVETSQCIVDALYGALGVLAASQGTMNNLTFGDERVQYYETIAGGSGAGSDFDGCDAVQTHMTNSRLTDPEILETKFPVLVREFRVRRGSGGAGRQHGGNGLIRRIEFRAPLSGALLADRRRVPPFGMAGGHPGAPGSARVVRSSGAVETLGATAHFAVEAGDAIEIRTPGGGGFGAPESA